MTYMLIRNKHLHIETYGSKNNPAILYLHGGPGESCDDFTYHQAKNLQKDFFFIALDQRGVCRSEGFAENEEFGLMYLNENPYFCRSNCSSYRNCKKVSELWRYGGCTSTG